MAVITYSKRQLIERLEKHFNDGFPGEDWKISTREMLLYVDQAIPYVMKGQMFENARVSGVLEIPEAYLITYAYTITTQDSGTKEWYVTLAQPPLALPTGYNITRCYIADPTLGQSLDGTPISAKRAAFRNNLPAMPGFRYRISGNKMYMRMWDGGAMYNLALSVQLPVSRTDSLTDELNIPDDAIDGVFRRVVEVIMQRYQIPQDIVKDNLMPGNKSS